MKMSNVFPCEDWRDIVPLNNTRNLYLKPSACITISVQLPADLPPSALESISTEEIMEKIQSTARPDVLIGLKVLKTAQQYVRIEAHVHNQHQIPSVLQRLDRSMLKLQNFEEPFKVRACEAKVSYATKKDWEFHFHLNRNQHELKPGERPDTVHVKMIPSHWFTSSNQSCLSLKNQKVKPSESVVRSIFECFGPIRNIDIPMLDPYRVKMFPNLENTYSMGHDGLFDAYIQFYEYGSFVKCMTEFRGMMLVLREGNKAFAASIQVDFDRTRHLSERSIKFRKTAREKLIQEDIDKERAEKLKKEKEAPVVDENRTQIQEERRIVIDATSTSDHTSRLEAEQRKMILAQRRLESIRLLDAVVEQVKAVLDRGKQDSTKKKSKKDKEAKRQSKLEKQEKILRAKLLDKYKEIEQAKLEEQKERVQLMQTTNGYGKKSVEMQPIAKSSVEPVVNRASSPPRVHQSQEQDRPSNGTSRPHYGREGPKPLGFRSNHNQGYDRRYEGHQGSGNYARNNTFNRKRYYPSEPYNSPSRQDSNRQDWKRNRYDSNKPNNNKSNWESNIDSELWDGPEVEFDQQNSRSSYRRGGRSGGDFHNRNRSHAMNDNSNVRMSRNEPRNSGSSYGQSLPDPIDRPV